MQIIQWNPKFSVGIASIDKQHQSLFDALNEFYNGLNQQKSSQDALRDLLVKLKDYTVYHFRTEEQLMQRYQFPGFELHKKEHDSFVAKINEIEERMQAGKLVISIEMTNMLKEWIENHIAKIDKQYSNFLLSHGVH